MLVPPKPANEAERLAALRALAILDTPPEERFDRITRTAKTLFSTAIAAISLVDDDREWFKSCQGAESVGGPRDISFCGHTILTDGLLVVPDAAQDPRFADNPQVVDDGIRFYAGTVLRSIGGYALGALCVKDTSPHAPTAEQLEALRNLAAWAQSELNTLELNEALAIKRESEARLRAVMDQAGDAILTVDGHGRIHSFNRAAQTMFACSAETACCGSLAEVFPEPIDLQALSAREVGQWVEVAGQRRNGGRFPAELSVGAVALPEQALFILVARDITERKARERELHEARQAAEQASRAKSQFLANMSHELRTPMNAIIGFSEILADETFGELNDKQQRYINNILTSGQHLLKLINDVLDLAKVEAGRLELEPTQFQSSAVLTDVQALVKQLASKKQIRLLTDLPDDLPVITADEAKMKQILYNLLSNAIKYTPEGGEVTTTAQVAAAAPPAGQSATGCAPYLLVSISDNGIGIAAEDMERLFIEFQQLDDSYRREQEGTGLGLALTKKLVALHGGAIWAESAGKGRGSVFSFIVPVDATVGDHAQQSPAAPSRPDAATAAPEDKTVLVVDDDDHARELIAHHLTQAGYGVEMLNGGQEVVARARELQPFAITLDIMMPGKDGFTVLDELRDAPDTATIPTIVISMADVKVDALRRGATAYLSKPVDFGRLNELLGSLPSHASSSANAVIEPVERGAG